MNNIHWSIDLLKSTPSIVRSVDSLGYLPWDTTIVFSKESLVRFLKTLDVEVDPNVSQLKKLPKFARCGTLSAVHQSAPTQAGVPSSSSGSKLDQESSQPASTPAFIPTRKVREQPGGGSAQITSLLGGDRAADAMNWVPPPIPQQPGAPANSVPADHSNGENLQASHESKSNPVMMPDGTPFVPSRKVREPVGGHSSMASLLAGEH